MVAAWQLNLQAQQSRPGQLTVCNVRSAHNQFGSQFGEVLAKVTDGNAAWETLGHPAVQQNDAVSMVCGIARRT